MLCSFLILMLFATVRMGVSRSHSRVLFALYGNIAQRYVTCVRGAMTRRFVSLWELFL